MRYVARMSFVDPFDGGEIVKGRTYVSHEADVYKKFPERFEVTRSSGVDGAITRLTYGADMTLNEPGSSSSRPRLALVDRPRRRPPERSASTSPTRPDWMLGPEPERESWRLR
jgi:hypothetical protein